MKNSIITSVESKLQEMKTFLSKIIDNMASKTFWSNDDRLLLIQAA